jgi:hypothetical protein
VARHEGDQRGGERALRLVADIFGDGQDTARRQPATGEGEATIVEGKWPPNV